MTIYFAELEGKSQVKIGYTRSCAARRIAQLQTGQPGRLKLLGTIPGDVSAERGLHKEFGESRINGEWFEETASLMSIIQFLN